MQNDEDYEEENANVVIDLGSGVVKAGFGGDDRPQAIFDNIIGKPKHSLSYINMMMTHLDIYVGDEAFCRKGVIIHSNPIKNGVVDDWNGIEKVIHHCYYNELRVTAEGSKLSMGEVVGNARRDREHLAELMFETFDIGSFFLAKQPFLSLISSQRLTGLVLESGESVTQILPIVDGFPLLYAAQQINFAGRDVTNYFIEDMNRNQNLFSTTFEKKMAKCVKEEKCAVSLDFRSEIEKYNSSDILDVRYEMMEDYFVTIRDERINCTEILFNPTQFAINKPSLTDLVISSINRCEPEIREVLLKNIVISGGNTCVNGFKERLEHELASHFCSENIKIISTTMEERKYSSWIGGSILSTLTTHCQPYITKQEYQETGPHIINKRCF